MADVYYGLAGSPVSHSLSPVLINIVAQHLSQVLPKGDKFSLVATDLIDAKFIQDALAWGYVKSTPNPIDWDLTGAPFGKFRNRALMQKVLDSTIAVKESFSELTKEERLDYNSLLPFKCDVKLPTKSFTEEVWINLTYPLKHQLKSPAVVDFNHSSSIESVNVLRFDGFGWWSSNVDGSGFVRVAEYFGINVASGACLGIIGGGGAARSTAHTWQMIGGTVKAFGGKRDLNDYDWFNGADTADRTCDVLVNFDDDSYPEDITVSGFSIKSQYHPINGESTDRVAALKTKDVDGRWLLAAQHLESWSQLWAPQFKDYLPSLDLLITKLIQAETILASYA
jgi:hypothetical protein